MEVGHQGETRFTLLNFLRVRSSLRTLLPWLYYTTVVRNVLTCLKLYCYFIPNFQLKTEDVESNEKRLDLFARVFNQTVTHKQTLSLASLLEIWPPLEGRRGGESAWYLVLTKLITDAQDGMSVVKLVREEENNIDLDKKVSKYTLFLLVR